MRTPSAQKIRGLILLVFVLVCPGIGLFMPVKAAMAECAPPFYRVEFLVQQKESSNATASSDARTNPNRPALSSSDFQQDAIADISADQLKTLISVRAQLAALKPLFPPLGICIDGVPNALAFPAGSFSADGAVVFSTGLLRLLGNNSAFIATVMAHEFAHIIDQHRAQAKAFESQAAQVGLNAATRVAANTGNIALATLVGKIEALKQSRAFSRAVEFAADERGYQMYVEAGFNISESAGALKLMRTIEGHGAGSYLDTHPAIDDRIARLEEFARNDIEKARRIAIAKDQALANAPYVATARELWQSKKWRALSVFVRTWLRDIPESAPAWYYKGLLMQNANAERRNAWEAFEKSVYLDPSNTDAWRGLCVSLADAGFRRECAFCVVATLGLGITAELKDQLFQDRLFIHGRGPQTPANLWAPRQPNGQRYITNDRTLLGIKGLPEDPVPPMWSPGR